MFSTIDVMVAQAHIDQLNELADTKHIVAPPEFPASPQTRMGCGLFACRRGLAAVPVVATVTWVENA